MQKIEWAAQENATALDLDFNNLTALPPEIGQLESLQTLSLYGNNLTALPPEIGQLKSLYKLDLRQNKFTTLPPEIGQLESLQTLSLYGNNLTALPPEIGQLESLYELALGNNKFAALPPEIGQLKSLHELDLGNNKFTALPPEIGRLSSLKGLNLYANPLTFPSPAVMRAGTNVIVDFLREILEQRQQMKVFISYKWEDSAHNQWVEKFATDLRTSGIEAILDRWEVRLGDSFTDYMTYKIKQATVVLFIMTPESVSSVEAPSGKGGALKFEMQMATARRTAGEDMRLIGIYRRGNETPAHLRDHRYADFRDDSRYQDNLLALIDDLLGQTGSPPVGAPKT